MRRKKEGYILKEGDPLEVHISESGFDDFFKGRFISMMPETTIIEDDEAYYFIPLSRIVFMVKPKNPKSAK